MHHGTRGKRQVAKGTKRYSSNIETNGEQEMEQTERNKYIIGRG